MMISQTPLRISFAGGGTDIPGFYEEYGGAVVSSAINKYIYVMVKPRFDRRIRVVAAQTEEACSLEEVSHDLVREAMRQTEVDEGVEIVILSDIPAEGSGLGSSGALTVGLLNALYAYRGRRLPPEELAEQACAIEIGRLKQPIGKQDQYASALGGLRSYQFRPDGRVFPELIKLTEAQQERIGKSLLLFYTGVTRSASEILRRQGANSSRNADHLLAIRQQCMTLIGELEKGNPDSLGVIMNEGWQLKKQLADGISNPQIDSWYESALKAGASGGKIAGAGGGGFLLLYADQAVHSRLRASLPLQELPFQLDRQGTRIILQQ